jgi:hypothetical protein
MKEEEIKKLRRKKTWMKKEEETEGKGDKKARSGRKRKIQEEGDNDPMQSERLRFKQTGGGQCSGPWRAWYKRSHSIH